MLTNNENIILLFVLIFVINTLVNTKKSAIKEICLLKFVFIVSGHTHTQYYTYFYKREILSIKNLVTNAVCSGWWQKFYHTNKMSLLSVNTEYIKLKITNYKNF